MKHSIPLPSDKPTTLAVPVSQADHVLGSADAPITLVEYGDYECPDCLNALPIVRQLKERLGEKLRFVFRHFPRSSVHPRASVAAMAAEAAGEQGKFWRCMSRSTRAGRGLPELPKVRNLARRQMDELLLEADRCLWE